MLLCFLPSFIRLSVSCLPPSLDVVHYVFEKMTNKLNDHQTKSVQALMTD
ncbi:hypothetical protein HMPREF0658_0428 [Hoylesella marshii DSM 16973 = JCM 13450]|uniref:Uncharacterized protein n=1 Tax=Hoylesella marshii DSM 16973 = JCM 13450 TaxID=862515 RepID=E0NQH7_9BACT|nr:hypothetical protein HMPREF0658_0428 [Hoylesella marshii DSM 16973 = JCM 13450]